MGIWYKHVNVLKFLNLNAIKIKWINKFLKFYAFGLKFWFKLLYSRTTKEASNQQTKPPPDTKEEATDAHQQRGSTPVIFRSANIVYFVKIVNCYQSSKGKDRGSTALKQDNQRINFRKF